MTASSMDTTTIGVTSRKPVGEVKSAARTVELLEMLASEQRPLTLSEIASRLSLPVSSVHQLLKTLVDRNWLAVQNGAYSIGVRALLTGMSFIERDPVVQALKPALGLLRAELEETLHLARLDADRVVYLLSRESQHQLRTVSRVGQTLPAHATALGRAALATLGDEQARSRLREPLERPTDETLATLAEVMEEVARTRRRGWAIERGENTPGTGCIAVAIPTLHGVYAVSCSMPLSRLSEQRTSQIADALMRTMSVARLELGA